MLTKGINFLVYRKKVYEIPKNCRSYAQAASILTTPKKEEKVEDVKQESLYPPIKTKYPPGKWQRINPESAWKIHETTQAILEAPSAKWRLEKLAGIENSKLWLVSPFAPRPNNLQFQKTITRTHILEGIPDICKQEADKIKDVKLIKKSYELVQRIYDEEFNKIVREYFDDRMHDFEDPVNKKMKVEDLKLKRLMSKTFKTLAALSSAQRDHLQTGEVDEDVRLETFWRVGGFEGEEKSAEGLWEDIKTVDDTDAGILTFQYKHTTDLQIRTQLPLPEFIAQNDPLCMYEVTPQPSYAPDAVHFEVHDARPISVSGQWLGGTCEFIPLALNHLPLKFVEKFSNYGSKYLSEAEELFLITSMFASCLSQAYNQGFCDFLDVTYPITTQTILTSGQYFRMASYQLNTTQLFNDANPMRNIAWVSEKMPLFIEENENVRKINPLFVESLLRCLLLETQDRGVNLRPYLPVDPSPLHLPTPINHINTPPLERYVPGRFEYPKHSIYF